MWHRLAMANDIHVYLSDEDMKALKVRAGREMRSITNMALVLIRQGLSRGDSTNAENRPRPGRPPNGRALTTSEIASRERQLAERRLADVRSMVEGVVTIDTPGLTRRTDAAGLQVRLAAQLDPATGDTVRAAREPQVTPRFKDGGKS